MTNIQTSRRGVIGMLAGLSAAGAGIVAAQPAKAAKSASAADAEIYEMIRKMKEAEKAAFDALHADTSAYYAQMKKMLAAWKRKKWRESGLRASKHESPWTFEEQAVARHQISVEIGLEAHCERCIQLDRDYGNALGALADAPQADTLAAVDALATAINEARYGCPGGGKAIALQLKNLAGKAVA